jgi:hypothetical protein
MYYSVFTREWILPDLCSVWNELPAMPNFISLAVLIDGYLLIEPLNRSVDKLRIFFILNFSII